MSHRLAVSTAAASVTGTDPSGVGVALRRSWDTTAEDVDAFAKDLAELAFGETRETTGANRKQERVSR